MSKRRSREVED